MEKKQTILLVHNFYQIGGGEHTVYENEKRLLEKNGHRVYTYTRDNHELNTSLQKKLLLPFTTVFSYKTYREIKKLIYGRGIDIVHCHNTFPLISPSVYYAARKCHIPVIQTIHNFRFLCPCGTFYHNGKICEDCVKYGLHCGVQNSCYRNSKLETAVVANMLWVHRKLKTYKKIHYIFLTEFNRRKFESLLGKQADEEFKPNFEFIDIQPVPYAQVDHNKFVFVGRLDENKGIEFLLRVWGKCKGKQLVIFGTGRLEKQVQKAALETPNIIFKGFQNHESVLKELRTAEAMIFPSECYEGFPMALIESFAVGTPVICTDLGNPTDIVRSARAGYCFRRGDEKDFCNKLHLVCGSPTLHKAARSAYEKCYTPECNYQILKQIYDKVCEENHA